MKEPNKEQQETINAYILTMDINEYDQHGEYFLNGWMHNPTDKEIKEAIKNDGYGSMMLQSLDMQWIRDNKGRPEPYRNNQAWFNLRKIT